MTNDHVGSDREHSWNNFQNSYVHLQSQYGIQKPGGRVRNFEFEVPLERDGTDRGPDMSDREDSSKMAASRSQRVLVAVRATPLAHWSHIVMRRQKKSLYQRS